MSPRVLASILILAALTGCATAPRPRGPATAPPQPSAQGAGLQIASAARDLVGAPYLFGGTTPAGLDCSGLVFFVHRQAGVDVPRTAATQYQSARPIPAAQLSPGDVVFFSNGGRDVTHVGVYIGAGEFIHAPKSGRPVSYASLSDDYYAVNFAGGGRLH